MERRFSRVRLACLPALLLSMLVPACDDEPSPTQSQLAATCEARPASGSAPLAVLFLLNVSGAEGPLTFAITYGDGTSGTNPDASHTYATPGSYTATFNVSTATQSARCTTPVTVTGGSAASPPPSGNQPPNGVFRTTPAAVGGFVTGSAPLTVTFNMCPTSDPEGDELFFEMDFEGDGKFDFKGITGFHCRADFVYAAGTYRPELCVHDRDKNGAPLHVEACQKFTVVAN